MIWAGSNVYTLWSYAPKTEWAVKFGVSGNGYPAARDRGAAKDIYKASVIFTGPLAELVALEAVLAANRNEFSITCGVGEEIFGADIDYTSPLTVTVTKYGEITGVEFPQFAMPLELRLIGPTFKAVTPSLASLMQSSWRFQQYSTFAITRHFAYSGAVTDLDHKSDAGVFTGEFVQTTAEMAAIRRFLLSSLRGSAMQFPAIRGINNPFGTRRPSRQFLKCHVIDWEDLGRANFTEWNLRLHIAEADPYFSAGSSISDDTSGETLLTPDASGSPTYYATPGG